MRRFLGAVLAALCFTTSFAYASTRAVVYPGQTPRSVDTNGQARFERLDKGTWRRDALGGACSTGAYANLSAVPNGGMYIAVQPTASNSLGSLYQMTVDDANPIPTGGTWSSFLAADNTQVCVHGMQSGPSASIGPITAPGGGTSQYFLVEAQLQQQDVANTSVQFVNSNNTQSFVNVNTQRVDVIVYQLKAGTAGVSPTAPSPDSGWIGVSNILVPGGASSITSGMITALPAFQGFIAQGASVSLQGLTITSLTSAGCLQNTGTGAVISAACTSGLGSVTANTPLTATTTAGVATVSCAVCVTSVSGVGNIASTGGTAPTLSITGVIPYANLPTTVAQTGVNNNFSVTQNFQSILGTSVTSSGYVVANAASTPAPQSGTNGVVAVAQATAAPTQQPGNIDVSSVISNAATVVAGQTGTNGPAVISQATSAPTAQPGNINVTGNITAGGSNGFIAGSSTYAPTSATVNGLVASSLAYGNFDYQLNSGCTSGHTGLGAASSTTVASVTASAFEFACVGTSALFVLDTSGNAGFSGNLYATAAYYSSRREWKQDISSLRGLDALDVLAQADWARFRFKPKFGDPSLVHNGFIANDTPSELAGPEHNHFDVESVATYDAIAILQLRDQLATLRIAVVLLALWVVGLTIVVLKIAGRRRA